MPKLEIISSIYLDAYKVRQKYTLAKHFGKLKQSVEDFSFYQAVAAVHSSQIEGNPIDIDTYMKYRNSGITTGNKPYKEIQDLINAYEFARTHAVDHDNLLNAHNLATKTMFKNKTYRGKVRDKAVGVFSNGKKIYSPASPEIVKLEFKRLMDDVMVLKNRKLTIDQTFYYASMLHLCFAHIHPFIDGNGRMARLLEKWFLAEMLGPQAWYIQSERNYFKKRISYYANIDLGKTYEELNYNLCIPFLLMLPTALRLR